MSATNSKSYNKHRNVNNNNKNNSNTKENRSKNHRNNNVMIANNQSSTAANPSTHNFYFQQQQSNARSASVPCLCFPDLFQHHQATGQVIHVPFDTSDEEENNNETEELAFNGPMYMSSFNLKDDSSSQAPTVTASQLGRLRSGSARNAGASTKRYSRTRSFDDSYMCPPSGHAGGLPGAGSGCGHGYWQPPNGGFGGLSYAPSAAHLAAARYGMPSYSFFDYYNGRTCVEKPHHHFRHPSVSQYHQQSAFQSPVEGSYSAKEDLYKPRPIDYNYNANSFSKTDTGGLNANNGCSYTGPTTTRPGQGQISSDPIGGGSYWDYVPYRSMRMAGGGVCTNDSTQVSTLSQGYMPGATPLSSINSSASMPGVKRRNRTKFCLIVCVLVIVLAVLVAMGVAVYSQVKTQSSIIKLVRQYRGYFAVINVQNSDFDTELLNPASSAFKARAKSFEARIDTIMKATPVVSVYEGSDVTSFKFNLVPPSSEVHFNLKTKVNADVPIQDLLLIFDDGIRSNVKGAFDGINVAPNSVTIETHRLQDQSQTS